MTRSVKKQIHQDSRRRCLIFLCCLQNFAQGKLILSYFIHFRFTKVPSPCTNITNSGKQESIPFTYPTHEDVFANAPPPPRKALYRYLKVFFYSEFQHVSTFRWLKQRSRCFVSPTEAACIFPPSKWDRRPADSSGVPAVPETREVLRWGAWQGCRNDME